MNKDSSIFVTGHRGLVGSAVCRRLRAAGYFRVLTSDRKQTDLLVKDEVENYFRKAKPEYVIHCAAKVGGIMFHSENPVAALAENLAIAENVICSAANANVKKLLFLGSACAYPKYAAVPIKEESLLTGVFEPSNEGYALAKIAGIKLCQAYKREQKKNFISCMPTNLYGPGDNYDLQNSHVIPGMMRRMYACKLEGASVKLWGTGTPTREFLYSEDLADACIFLMNNYDGEEALNVGSGEEMSLARLATKIARTIGYAGKIRWDSSKPDGTPRRFLDSSKIFGMGWRPKVTLEQGLHFAYDDFLQRV
jgi:GDP-L-fucose synthase